MSNFRRTRGISENIFLVRLEQEPSKITFHILGSSKRVYQVHFNVGKTPVCSCPDCSVRKTICKHIWFVCEKITKIQPENWETVTDIASVMEGVVKRVPHLIADKYFTDKYNKLMDGRLGEKNEDGEEDNGKIEIRNDECAVCLCDLEAESSTQVMLCATCRNGIHSECWTKWASVNGSNQCVYCRTVLTGNAANPKEAQIIADSGWGVLLQ